MHRLPGVSGAPYDWRRTRGPERLYRHAYHVSLVDKIFLCAKPDPSTGEPARVFMTFEQALERIRKINAMTRGIPKIVYLVGWQYEGHDSKYPSWAEANEHLKRPCDASALDSLKWLMEEGRKHHTTVSLHINMNDAYPSSPDWQEYCDAGVIGPKGGVWGGEQCWLIHHDREWESGLAKRRIDALLAMLPIVEAGTIHVDAFGPVGSDVEADLAGMRRIVRYWRDCGVDVTIEDIPPTDLDSGLYGLVPMVWHLNMVSWKRGDEFTDEHYMELPASVFCACTDHSPRASLFGTGMQGESILNEEIERYLPAFCLGTLPWQYMNRRERTEISSDGGASKLWLSGSLVSRVEGERRTLRQGDWTLVDGGDVFVPAAWQPAPEIVAFSRNGYESRRWLLPPEWRHLTEVTVRKITPEGLGEPQAMPVGDGRVDLALAPGQAVSVTPVI